MTKAVDPLEFRRVMGHFPTGVSVLTTVHEGKLHGMTANSLTSVSLEPMLVLACLACGARTALAIQNAGHFAVNILSEDQLEMSKRFGANVVINPKEEDPVAKIMSLTGGSGVDVAVEAVGTQATFEACTKAVRRGGVVSSVGVYGLVPQLTMPTFTAPSFLHRKVVTTLCPSGSARMESLLALIENAKIDLHPLFTHRMTLDETPKAYDLFRSKAEGVLKIAITP